VCTVLWCGASVCTVLLLYVRGIVCGLGVLKLVACTLFGASHQAS
jgi:hypothetical protein